MKAFNGTDNQNKAEQEDKSPSYQYNRTINPFQIIHYWCLIIVLAISTSNAFQTNARCSNGPYFYTTSCDGGGEGIGSAFHKHSKDAILFAIDNGLTFIPNPMCFSSAGHMVDVQIIFGLDSDCAHSDLVDEEQMKSMLQSLHPSKTERNRNRFYSKENVEIVQKLGFSEEESEIAMQYGRQSNTETSIIELALDYALLFFRGRVNISAVPLALNSSIAMEWWSGSPIKVPVDRYNIDETLRKYYHMKSKLVFITKNNVPQSPDPTKLRSFVVNHYLDQLHHHPRPIDLNTHCINIAVHFRWGDVRTHNPHKPDGRALPLAEVFQTIHSIYNESKVLAPSDTCIRMYAEDASEELFQDLFHEFPTAKLFAGNASTLIYEIDQMVASDIFIFSRSSFSHLIGFLHADGVVIKEMDEEKYGPLPNAVSRIHPILSSADALIFDEKLCAYVARKNLERFQSTLQKCQSRVPSV